MRAYITDEDFEKLPPETQRQYYWCPDCEMFYLKERTKTCVCKFPD